MSSYRLVLTPCLKQGATGRSWAAAASDVAAAEAAILGNLLAELEACRCSGGSGTELCGGEDEADVARAGWFWKLSWSSVCSAIAY